jgi:hypothetical protein
MTNIYPRETVEHLPVPVTVDGALVTTGVTLAVVAKGERPVTFATPLTLNGKIGVLLTGMAPGFWDVYAKVSSSSETPVIYCGYFQIT